MTDRPNSSSAFVGSVPELYERHLGPLLFQPYARDLAARAARASHGRVLELACGTGILTRALLRTVGPDAHLTATDLAEPMLQVAQRHVSDPRVRWQQADAMALPFEPGSFDLVVCQFGVMFFPDKAAAAAEVRRVLAPSGVYLFNVWGSLADNPLGRVAQDVAVTCFPDNPPTFYHVPWGYHDPRQVEHDLHAGGFRDVLIEAVDIVGHSITAEDAAIGMVQGSPMANAIAERGTLSPGEVTSAVAAAFTRELGGDPIAAPMRALVVRAT